MSELGGLKEVKVTRFRPGLTTPPSAGGSAWQLGPYFDHGVCFPEELARNRAGWRDPHARAQLVSIAWAFQTIHP